MAIVMYAEMKMKVKKVVWKKLEWKVEGVVLIIQGTL